MFATPKVPVQVVNPPVSDQPFIDPASARTTGPVRLPAVQASTGSNGKKDSKKKHKSSHHKSSKVKPVPVEDNTGPVQEMPTDTMHYNNLNRYRLERLPVRSGHIRQFP